MADLPAAGVPAAAAATNAAAHNSDDALRSAPAQACSTDALGVIFSFLPLCDVAASAATCRRWSTAATAGSGGCGRHRTTATLRTLRALATSPFRKLVGEITLSSPTLVAADHVESLWCAFPHLTSLSLEGEVDARLLTADNTLAFPTTLRALYVKLAICTDWSQLDVLLSSAGRCPLTRLRVEFPYGGWPEDAPPASTIERLLALRDTLTDLELRVKDTDAECRWREDHIAVFRSLTRLTRLRVSSGVWHSPSLEQLAAMPITLTHLRSIDFEHTEIDEASFLALARLPSLVAVEMRSLSHPALLTRMPAQIETLLIRECGDADRSDQLAHALARCTAITDLDLARSREHASDACSLVPLLLPALLSLRRLSLACVPTDLACIATAPHLADTLERLSIHPVDSPASLIHLRTLRRLQSLRLTLDLSSGSGETSGGAEEDDREETVFLPDLEHLELITRGECDEGVDLGRFFGRLPALRRAELTHREDAITTNQTMRMIKKMTGITSLKLEEQGMQSEELSQVLSSLLCLRELQLTYHGRDLTFLSSASAPHLARTLERLTIFSESGTLASPAHLILLRSLSALQYLCLDLQFQVWNLLPGEEDLVDQPNPFEPTSSLASLREMRVYLSDIDEHAVFPSPERPATRPTFDFGRLFGPMPQLRMAKIDCGVAIRPASLSHALAHSTLITELSLRHYGLTDAHLLPAIPPLSRLRFLRVVSIAIDGLSFLAAPHLAATLEDLAVLTPHGDDFGTPVVRVPASDLHQLRAFRHLRTLDVALHITRNDDEVIDEYDLDQANFRRDLWPCLHYSDVSLL